VVFRGRSRARSPRGVLAVDSDPRSWWRKLQRGESQESNGPVAVRKLGREPLRASGSPRERILERRKASKRAERPSAGEPEGLWWPSRSTQATAEDRRSNDRGEPRSRFRGRDSVALFTAQVVRRTRGAAAGVAPGGKRSRDPGGLRAGSARSRPNPQGSRRPSEGGTASREGKALKGESQGRLRHGTGPRSYGA
jgi:hypothetical protein